MSSQAKLSALRLIGFCSAQALAACAAPPAAQAPSNAGPSASAPAASPSSEPDAAASKPLAGAPKCAKAALGAACQDVKPAAPPSAVPPPGASASAAAPPPPAPAKPVQSGLARGTSEPSDLELSAGDRAYQADDLNGARAHYEKARRLAPKDPAPQVGL
ncbi:MAG TPA: hypothetical protein VGL19_17510, partial [Polyangiaceae bacterium]